MDFITNELARIEANPSSTELILPIVYNELRALASAKLSQELPGQTLSATALVHEAYLRLTRSGEQPVWDSRGHFFAAAAEAMRRILINRARDKKCLKRAGGRQRIDLDLINLALDTPNEELLALDEALKALAAEDAECAELIELKFFVGLSLKEAAQILGISPRTADRRWSYARAWLFKYLQTDESAS